MPLMKITKYWHMLPSCKNILQAVHTMFHGWQQWHSVATCKINLKRLRSSTLMIDKGKRSEV